MTWTGWSWGATLGVALAIAVAPGCAPRESGWVCSGWRQTSGCRGDGPREPVNDRACDRTIESGASGFCDCAFVTGSSRVPTPRLFDCGHAPLTCSSVCQMGGGTPAVDGGTPAGSCAPFVPCSAGCGPYHRGCSAVGGMTCCSGVCDFGYCDCDGNRSNGCETPVSSGGACPPGSPGRC